MEQIYNTKLIDTYLKENKMSKTAFCKQCKISDELLKKFYKHMK